MNENGGRSHEGIGKHGSLSAQDFEKLTLNSPSSPPGLPRIPRIFRVIERSPASQEKHKSSASGTVNALESPSKRAISFQTAPGQNLPPPGNSRQKNLSKSVSKDKKGGSHSETFDNDNNVVAKNYNGSSKHWGQQYGLH